MLRKISVENVKTGMFIHQMCGAWIDIPFWTKSFLVSSEQLRIRVQASGVRDLIIDTDRGDDLADDVPAAPMAAAPAPAPAPAPAAAPASARAPLRALEIAPASVAQEFGRAARVIAKSKLAVSSMFSEARMGQLSSVEGASALVEEISASVLRNPQALVALSRLKTSDDYTYMHSVAVCAMMIALARQLGLSDQEVQACGEAGLLHDIGKMAIPPAILNKPGRLTDDEFTSVRAHPRAGYEMLASVGGISPTVLDVCLHHHEKFDGSGYPSRLTRDAISLYARMGAVCDVYDAITSNRPYKAGWCPAESLRRMAEWSKEGHFDPAIFTAFVKCVGIYPIGTLLKLASGRLAVVVDISKSLLRPVVKVLFSTRSMTYLPPQVIDLSLMPESEAVVSREDASQWGLVDIERYWSQA
ncbi:HD-GYP domain-containing protein [Duganella sp. LX20W]|uniref:HD-GYP domain-containing protein n=1 Tax=Rugamonas brunnea TaxID=2758569 RepID=A0A7W2ETL2_9BURK|nr:HD-GYP domain-containing protein [Rugamonas brunnea]MBA5638388.1 HD-GYP domain-containing protein [Rugamonas brunnea]